MFKMKFSYITCFIILKNIVFAEYNGGLVTVKLNSGLLQGNIKTLDNGLSYYNFQGIPYALPPLGNLRFKDPVPLKKWNGLLDATRYGHSCIEMAQRQTSFFVFGNEDCLYLNVYTPQNPNKIKDKLPVMAWIYGGGFREGNSSLYEPNHLIKDDVVLVTFNYRLGFFGFLSTEDSNAPGNYGLKDIVLALRWIKNNINRFGGDPNRVTVFGESAGAATIGYLLVSPMGKGLFHAAIMQSGSPLCPWALHRNARKVAFDLGIAMGLTTNSSAKLINYLRSCDIPNEAMVNVNLVNTLEMFKNGGPFGPVIEHTSSNAFLTGDTLKAYESGQFQKVPILIGSNSQESKFFKTLFSLIRGITFINDISPSSLVRSGMNIKSNRDKRTVGEKIKEFYFKSKRFIDCTDLELAEFMTDDFFLRPIAKTAELLSRYVPVYYYVYDYEGSLGKRWLRYIAEESSIPGAAHATEVWYLWKTSILNQAVNDNDKLTTERLVRLWTNFAKYGKPTVRKERLLNNLIWPTITGTDMDYFYIGKDLRTGKNYKENSLRFWEALYQNYSRGPFETY